MKIHFLLMGLAGLVMKVNGECANQCSGHGRCTNYKATYATATTAVPSIKLGSGGSVSQYGYDTSISKKDSCTCFTRHEDGNTVYAWTGPDCSQRTCPHGRSWAAAASSANEHALQAECSDAGICDRTTGTCVCFPGYEGKGCRRASCPNQCSGHGRCKTLNEIAKLRSENDNAWASISEFDHTTIQYKNAWDADKIQGCECDSGYRGADCSLVECPTTTDPMGGLGSESGRECSGRGLCDYTTGTCKCFATYGGDSCEKSTQSYL